MSRPTLLIPVVFPGSAPESLVDANLGGLSGFDVVLFGYWEVPGGATAERVRADNETEAEAVLYDLAARFSEAGASTDVELHFGPGGDDRRALGDRILAEADPDAVLLPGSLTLLNNVLVALRDGRKRDRVVEVASAFDGETMFALELFHAAPDEATVDPGREMLAEVRERFLAEGFSADAVETTVEVADDPAEAIARRARNHNVVVMGETELPDAEDRLFGPVYRRVADGAEVPVVVVRE